MTSDATVTSRSAPPADDVARLAEVRTLSEQLPRLMRLVHAVKAQLVTDGRDRAALVLLFPLARSGPLRQGALAELVHADPSTISRHVAALVEQGLVRRIADETDGRASKLLVTDEGHAALESLSAERERHLGAVTRGWDAADLATLTSLLGRFLDDFAESLPRCPEPLPPARENR